MANSGSSPQQPDNNQASQGDITPELVRQVADRVYALWLRDLEINNERRRSTRNQQSAKRNYN